MNALRRWWKLALAIVGLMIAAQIGVSLLVRTHRVHNFLVAQLGKAFGRPVEVSRFEAHLLFTPTLDASGITVGEDPAFGNEYFLRAETFSAGLRWTGLLRGRFEFGTLTFTRPSLILVRNAEGRWNLERWLPPAKASGHARLVFYGPAQAAPSNNLQKIEFDEGRVNFKIEYDKQAFAFIDVSGSVEQVAPGRWQLQIAATPWRSGVALQSTGRVTVHGDLAGTSARLQPAKIQMHWAEASLADIFRLSSGQDYGVRGLFALDATLQSGISAALDGPLQPHPGGWTFAVKARATRVHRWDLAERADNPRLNASVQGNFFSDTRAVGPAHFSVEAPQSNLRGDFSFGGGTQPEPLLRVDSMGVQAADLLAWCRAFQTDVDEGISAQQFLTGGAALRGWPPQLESAGFSSAGGLLKIPGIDGGVQIGPLRGGRERSKLAIEPVRISWKSSPAPAEKSVPPAKRKAPDVRSAVGVGFTHDFSTGDGRLTVDGHAAKAEQILRMAQAIGRPLNRGWDLTGEANAALQWNWSAGRRGRWNGKLGFSHARLQVVGLNQPLLLDDAELDYQDGRRIAEITKVQGFGANWNGEISQLQSGGSVAPAAGPDAEPKWQFQLHADKVDAAELDRWVGPRARPGWLRRLMNSLLGSANVDSAANIPASELIRRVSADGEVRIDDLTIEKLKLSQVRAKGSLHALQTEIREAEAQWAGGIVRGTAKAQFAPKPGYEVSVEFDRVNMALLPSAFATRLGGLAAGTLQLAAEGVGREALLKSLQGSAQMRLKNVELRGWDVPASMADGAAHPGVSRWPSGAGLLRFRDHSVLLDDFHLASGKELTLINGRITFGQDADLSMETGAAGTRANFTGAGRVLKISGPLDVPRVSVENAVARQPAD